MQSGFAEYVGMMYVSANDIHDIKAVDKMLATYEENEPDFDFIEALVATREYINTIHTEEEMDALVAPFTLSMVGACLGDMVLRYYSESPSKAAEQFIMILNRALQKYSAQQVKH